VKRRSRRALESCDPAVFAFANEPDTAKGNSFDDACLVEGTRHDRRTRYSGQQLR
jgi:hypothetical protein